MIDIHSTPKLIKTRITANRQVGPANHLLAFDSPEIASIARPGQFVMVKCGAGKEKVLRRPFGIHQTRNSEVFLYFASVGEGTRWLASLKTGDKLDVLGPLGNSFTIRPGTRRLLLLAGGAGISPLVFLAVEALKQYRQVQLFQGAGSKDHLYVDLENFLPKNPRLVMKTATDDGSAGKKGFVTEYLKEYADIADQICACGPPGMYSAMEEYKHLWRRNPCQVSLETRMGCGIGACFGCTINTRNGLKRVCRDGPVFEMDDVILPDVRI